MQGKVKTRGESNPLSPINIGVFEACIIGLVAALGAVLLKEGVGFVGTLRVRLVHEMGPLVLPAIGLIGGLIAGLMVRYLGPEIRGSGIAQTKACLAGADVPLGLRTAILKLAACVVSLGCGLGLGREGPTVQVAAGISARVSTWIHTTPVHRNQLIAAGAGAGLAAAFNAPLAGALFVLEVLLKRMSGLAVGTTVVACFVAAVIARLVGVHSLDIDFNALSPKATFATHDIPFYVALGIISGVFGAFFNKTQLFGMRLTRDVIKIPLPIWCAIAGLITGCVLAAVPPFFANYAGLRELLVRGAADIHMAVVALVGQFWLTTIAFWAGLPGGIFAPSLTLGACLGHLVAAAEHAIIGTTNVETFSIVGMGAVFCAVARSPMTAVVIIFEMTTDFNVVLPLMICCVISFFVAEQLDPGSMYDRVLRWQGIILKDDEPAHGLLGRLKAGDVMQKEVEHFQESDNLGKVRESIKESARRYFPVVSSKGKLVGVVTRKDVEAAEKKRLDDDVSINRIMTPNPVKIRSDQSLAEVLTAVEQYQLNCVPVVERSSLVGIITESDIVRAESKALGMKRRATSGSYVVYQTRAPSAGIGRLLVAVADPGSASSLIRTGARVAKSRQFELECLNVIVVPKDQDPTEAKVSPSVGRRISEEAEKVGHEFKIPVHTNIRVSHDIGDAISDTVLERKIDVFLMRWSGSRRNQKGDSLLRSVLENTKCGVILISRLSGPEENKSCLIPVARFLESKAALELVSTVASVDDVSLNLVSVSPEKNSTVADEVEEIKESIERDFGMSVSSRTVKANSATSLLRELSQSEGSDVIILGMDRKSLLKSMQHSSFKKVISRGSSAVVLVCSKEEPGL